MKKETLISNLKIIPYRTEHQPWFERLNRTWIEKFFWMEPIDFDVLTHPEDYIIKDGGVIFMAQYDQEIIGTAALKFVESGVYEFTKMAVDERFRDLKVGQALTERAIETARKSGALKIILFSSTKLIPAINLYKKIGFKEIPVDGIYRRSDIKMELILDN